MKSVGPPKSVGVYSFGNGKLRLRSLQVSEFSYRLLKTEGTKRIRPKKIIVKSRGGELSSAFGTGKDTPRLLSN